MVQGGTKEEHLLFSFIFRNKKEEKKTLIYTSYLWLSLYRFIINKSKPPTLSLSVITPTYIHIFIHHIYILSLALALSIHNQQQYSHSYKLMLILIHTHSYVFSLTLVFSIHNKQQGFLRFNSPTNNLPSTQRSPLS